MNPKAASPKERDAMVCRSCGNQERASEGYPCVICGAFTCVMCNFRGVRKCKDCRENPGKITPNTPTPPLRWPEH